MTFNEKNTYLRVCFTANLPEGKDFADYPMEPLYRILKCSFLVAQPEEEGHKHWQGYAEFPRRKLGSAILNGLAKWGIKAHVEPAAGTAAQNVTYCTKEETSVQPELRFTAGEAKQDGQGSRTDLSAMVEAIKAGATDKDLLELDTRNFMVHHKAFAMVRQILAPKRTEPSKLIFIYGPTGTFKTRTAMTLEPEVVEWDAGRFILGYTGSKESVLFDDFEWEKMNPKFFLRLVDRYPMDIGTKGGSMCWAPKVIVFTSNDDPTSWWPDAPAATRDAIRRRMEEFGEMKNLDTGTVYQPTLLTSYFKSAPSASTETATGTSSAGAVITLSSDTESDDDAMDDDDGLSDYEIERRLKRKHAMLDEYEESRGEKRGKGKAAAGPSRAALHFQGRKGGKPPKHP